VSPNRRIAIAAFVAACATAWAEDPAKDEAARRAAIAKLGRMAWSGKDTPLEFCDLDGGNVLATDVGRVSFVRWLPDGRRVLASSNDRVFVVDAATGKSKDLGADLPDDRFASWIPSVSPDARYAVFWHTRVGGPYQQWMPFAYSVFDLDAGTRTDVGPIVPRDATELWTGGPPFAWWSPDGALFAAVCPGLRDSPKPGTRWQLVKWTPADGKREVVAEAPTGTRFTRMAFRGNRFAYVLGYEDGHGVVPSVRLDDGSTVFELTTPGSIFSVAWEPDGDALRVRTESGSRQSRAKTCWRVVPGKPATQTSDVEPKKRVPSGDPAWEIETRNVTTNPDAGTFPSDKDDPETGLFRVSTATGEATHVCPGSSPQRVGDVVVFWRVTVPSKKREGPYFEMPPTIWGTDDLWAYDVKDGAVIRLSTRGFNLRCLDIRPTPDARKDK
jgi:hypothetical protein